jgi:DNA-binding transcriptional LysR family regulator
LDFRSIEDFLSLAHTGSFSRSAEDRFITQPAFSRRIRSLESWVGAPLVDRSTYPITLTASGQVFRSAAQEMLRTLATARRDILELSVDGQDMAAIAVLHSLSMTFVPDWMRQWDKFGERPRCRFKSDNLHSCVDALVNGDVDLLLCFTSPAAPLMLDPGKFVNLLLARDVAVPVCRPDESGRALYALPGTQDRPCHLLQYATDSYLGRLVRQRISSFPDTTHIRTLYENSFTEALKVAALSGHGTTWLPRSSISNELAAGTLVLAGGHDWNIDLDIRLYRTSSAMGPQADTVWHYAELGVMQNSA